MAGFGDPSSLQFSKFGIGATRRQHWLGGRWCSSPRRGDLLHNLLFSSVLVELFALILLNTLPAFLVSNEVLFHL